jgi:hypothetical protein
VASNEHISPADTTVTSLAGQGLVLLQAPLSLLVHAVVVSQAVNTLAAA